MKEHGWLEPEWLERCLIFSMRFILTATGLTISNQLRAYAEYRLFTRIARYATGVGEVRMALRLDGGVYRCTAAIELASFGPFTIQARARHPNEAIDRLAERAARLLSRCEPRSASS